MRKFIYKAVVILAVCAVTSLAAFAKPTSRTVTFASDVTVNGTAIKAGTYKIVFDETAGQLSVMKGNKTVATATGRLEKKDEEAGFSYNTNGDVVVAIGLDHGNEVVLGN